MSGVLPWVKGEMQMDKRRTILIVGAWIIMCSTCFAQTLKVGDVVWAQWKPNAWYHGKIERENPVGFHVAFDDGDRADLPPSLIVADRAVTAEQVEVGSRVLARWTDGRHYPGTVTRVAEGRRYDIRFDDGDRRTVNLAHVRLRDTLRNMNGAPNVGDVVWAQWKPNAWYHGKVEKKIPVGFHVVFDDGDRADLPPSLIVADRAVTAEQVVVGRRVLARWTDGKHYPGTVAEVAEGRKYDIRFDDGDRKTVDLMSLRLLSE